MEEAVSSGPEALVLSHVDSSPIRVGIEPYADRVQRLAEFVAGFNVETAADAQRLGDWMQAHADDLRSGKFAELESDIKASHRWHTFLCSIRKPILDVFEGAMATARQKLADWKIAEDGRLALAARQRELDEARREEDRRLEEAELLESAGDSQGAVEVIDAPMMVAPAGIRTPKIAGVTFSEKWRAEVRDLDTFIKACAANPAWRPLLVPDQKAINKLAAALKGKLTIPGLRVWPDTDVSRKGSR